MFYEWRRYVPVAERRRNAARELAKRKKAGHAVAPVVIEGRTIARTFWGKAWCDNLERYSDFANRLPRGRTYVRNGSVVDLHVAPGEVRAVVSGSALYDVNIRVTAVPAARWERLCADCAGAVDSLVELLQGRLSKGVMERICREGTGLFPSPKEIKLTCSCPDWATMCKHVAAVLYGVGARLDQEPALLFRLRQVDESALIARAGAGIGLAAGAPAADRVLGDGDLAALFGVDLAPAPAPQTRARAAKATPAAAPKTRARAAKAAPASGVLEKGTPVRMLAGVYAGASGRITWVRVAGPKVTYAIALVDARGRKATTQVAASSRGTKWEPLPGP